MTDPGPAIGVALAALALVGVVVRWAVARANTDAENDDKRLAAYDQHTLARISVLEEKVERMEQELRLERRVKHGAVNRMAAYHGTLQVVKWACDALELESLPGALAKLLGNIPENYPSLDQLAAAAKEGGI